MIAFCTVSHVNSRFFLGGGILKKRGKACKREDQRGWNGTLEGWPLWQELGEGQAPGSRAPAPILMSSGSCEAGYCAVILTHSRPCVARQYYIKCVTTIDDSKYKKEDEYSGILT